MGTVKNWLGGWEELRVWVAVVGGSEGIGCIIEVVFELMVRSCAMAHNPFMLYVEWYVFEEIACNTEEVIVRYEEGVYTGIKGGLEDIP